MARIHVSDQPETHTTTGPDHSGGWMTVLALGIPAALVIAAVDLHQRKYGDDTPAD